MLFLAFEEAGGVPEHLYLEEPQWMWKEQGFWLRLATCCARIAGLFALLTFIGLTDGGDRHLEATEGPRNVCVGEGLMGLHGGNHVWPSSPSCPPRFSCLSLMLCLFLHHFQPPLT